MQHQHITATGKAITLAGRSYRPAPDPSICFGDHWRAQAPQPAESIRIDEPWRAPARVRYENRKREKIQAQRELAAAIAQMAMETQQ